MRSKLECSLAELTKLKNQIRVQLNHLRPTFQIIPHQRPAVFNKKMFNNSYKETDILNPPKEKSQTKASGKKRFNQMDILIGGDRKPGPERKHYQRHYADQVDMEIKVRRRRSSYLEIKNSTSPIKDNSNSLLGIGLNDKSNYSGSRSGKKIHYNKHIYKQQLI